VADLHDGLLDALRTWSPDATAIQHLGGRAVVVPTVNRSAVVVSVNVLMARLLAASSR
jgi:hypothetical protein